MSWSTTSGRSHEPAAPGDLSAPDSRSTSTLVHTPDSMALATAMEDGTSLWDSESGEPLAHVPVDTDLSSPAPVAFHPSGCLMVDGALMDVAHSREHDLVLASRTGEDGRARFLVAWDPDTGEEFRPEGPSTSGPEVHPFTLSDDGSLLTGVRSEGGAVAVYEIDPELGYFPRMLLGGRD
ncbi:hypothetical protein ACWGSK_06775 [Nocardiopsis sp. NPDC055551]